MPPHSLPLQRPLYLPVANGNDITTPTNVITTPTNVIATPTNHTIPPQVMRRQSQLIRLETIKELLDDESPSNSTTATPPSLDKFKKQSQSALSETDLFATPTGSLTSLNNITETEV